MKQKNSKPKDNLTYLNHLDDQYQNILDNVDLNESTDSETTDFKNFRVINKENSYPQE